MPKTLNVSPSVKPYVALGLDIQDADSEAPKADCPFCGREKKLGISNKDERDGRFRCVACDVSGNPASFCEQLHHLCMTTTTDYSWIESHRELPVEAMRAWGVCKSVITGEWLVPSYSLGGKVCNLYRYVRIVGKDGKPKYVLYQTPGGGLSGGVFGLHFHDPQKKGLDICEGPWDGIALWWSLRLVKQIGDKYLPAKSVRESLSTVRNVVAVPGCGHFPESLSALCEDRDVTLYYDNDHPRTVNNVTTRAGFDGLKRSYGTILGGDEKPSSVSFLCWDKSDDSGGKGYDSSLPDGYDVRDVLSPRKGGEACDKISELFSMVKICPHEWAKSAPRRTGANRNDYIRPEACDDWGKLLDAWNKAAKWNDALTGALTVLLSAVASVPGTGEKVCVKLISPPSTFKSKLCSAIGVARKYTVEDDGMNGFYSGYRSGKEGEEGKDHSLISRLYNRTLITKEGATLVDSPIRDIIISQFRSLYDGSASKSYNNGIRLEHHGIQFNWILAGTQSLRRLDASELGQRFIDYVIMEEIDPVMEADIMQDALMKQWNAPLANCSAESTHDPYYLAASKLTGGYVHYLRTTALTYVNDVTIHPSAFQRIGRLATFVEFLRARPSNLVDDGGVRALGTRVGGQMLKMVKYAAVVQNKPAADHADLWRVVEKVATDTGRGRTFDIAKHLAEHRGGLTGIDVARLTNRPHLKEMEYLSFLRRLGVVELANTHGNGKYALTKRFRSLWNEVVGEGNNTKDKRVKVLPKVPSGNGKKR